MKKNSFIENDYIFYEITVEENKSIVSSPILSALDEANSRLDDLDGYIKDTTETIGRLTPDCDKLDYALAASSGVLCGVIDIFLVGTPKESPIGNLTDNWYKERVKDFARRNDWDENKDGSFSGAIRALEERFKIPYDQTGIGGSHYIAFDMDPKNHHFESLGHNPSLLGLFFSVMDQFYNRSHFVWGGEVYTLEHASEKWESIPGKFVCAFVNWFGHLMSDISGSSSSKTRGMGIPSPLWTWTNDLVVIKRSLRVETSDFDRTVGNLAIKLFEEGYDARFQTTQAIPVIVNEIITRLLYSIRRMVGYFKSIGKEKVDFPTLWKKCEPFSNASVKRMLTVAHGSFCAIDAGDATARAFIAGGGNFNPTEFFLRLNIVGVGRFTISLYGEAQRAIKSNIYESDLSYAEKERKVLVNYIEGLRVLAEKYDDENLLDFADDFLIDGNAEIGFQKTVELAKKRGVPDDKQLKNLSNIDAYFLGGTNG